VERSLTISGAVPAAEAGRRRVTVLESAGLWIDPPAQIVITA